MLNLINGYTVGLGSPFDAFQMFTTDPLPPGTNVYATTCLSMVDTLFFGNSPDPTFGADAIIWSWTFYQQDGTQSDPQYPADFFQNQVQINNCATITFAAFAERAWTYAQFNVFSF
jgi:hypothetical protein